ncbi:hypothetical protein MYCTH_2128884 [Thermothelomyces thermophilus ATCC 42464]|uniref:2EXR domain-containing protein n=1 Tax=Thermothelomyces thermophilus (strain ATCC 42464 / BCRC 31852 / DSM 1799) TaxID=573729 RepID=G2QJP3_THET4|nr:uncharacterized protein MYCTH_2128884 [Thermothelomyces thermophilus ATCC 42464]AEO59800.1 hypothetical protein MYCTH_2128884 [Thermothelomyces thermophilus ATCC 42464]
MAHQTFPQFRRLPTEIRVMIWELCLPQRVIRLSSLVIAHSHHHYHDAALDPTIERLLRFVFSRSCLVSYVCRESRAVATMRRVPVTDLDLPWLGRGTWFDPRTDTLMLDCDVFFAHSRFWLQLRRKLFPGPRVATSRVRLAVVKDLATWYFNYLQLRHRQGSDQNDRRDRPDEGDGAPLPAIRQISWAVEMKEVYLPLPMRDVAIRAGWAGPLREAACRQVEVRQGGLLERLERLAIPHVMDMREAGTMVAEALDCWANEYSKIVAMSRALGFEGSEKEWRKNGGGPYPVFTTCMCDSRQW